MKFNANQCKFNVKSSLINVNGKEGNNVNKLKRQKATTHKAQIP